VTTLSGTLLGVRSLGSGIAVLFLDQDRTAYIESGFGLWQLAAHRGPDLGIGEPITLTIDDLGLVAGVEEE
jgi:hypothetical protein